MTEPLIYGTSRLDAALQRESLAWARCAALQAELADALERLELAEFVSAQVAREFREYRETHP